MARGGEGRGTRRLLLALALSALGVAALAFAVLKGTQERSTPALGPAASTREAARAPEAALVSAGAEDPVLAPEPAAPEEARGEAAPSEQRAERIPVPLGLHGRVVDVETGAPLAGVAVERTFAGSVDQRAVSGPDGAFAFPQGFSKHGTLSAVLAGWRFEPARVVLRKLERDEVDFRGTLIRTAPLHGRLVDARTGEPVPRYRIGLDTVDEDSVGAVTDEQGRFATEGELELGQVHVYLSESGGGLTLEHGAEGASAEHELSVPLGPTFYFDLQAPAGIALEELTVMLLDPVSVPAWSVLSQLDEPSSGWLFEPDLDERSYSMLQGFPRDPEAELRSDGDPAWARFAPLDAEDFPLPGPDGYALLIVGEGGGGERWAGVGHAASLVGVQEQRIAVRLASLGQLSGSVSTADGDRVQNAVVTLRGAASAPPLACVTDGDGEFGFWEPAGRYELTVESRQGMLGPLPVELAADEVELDLELRPGACIEVAGTIRGSIRSGPRIDEFAPIELRSLANPSLRFMPVLDRDPGEEGEELVAAFRFGPVPAGAYELLAEPYMGIALEPSRILVDRTATDLELVCRDDFQRTTLGFLVLDPEGNPADNSFVLVWVEGERRPILNEGSGSNSARFALPAGVPVRWAALAEDCLPAEGTWRGSEGEEEVRVRMERGRAFSILVVDPWFNGVDQAELLIDGAAAGRTNELGYGIFDVQRVPGSARIRKDGWADVDSYCALEEGLAFFVLAPENPSR